ncbi:MAG: 23S rRNA (pseudouridine(1915)-N(3))-methyltransferase RlmH [Anaerorhabdus sp.]
MIRCIAVGKLKEKYWQAAFQEYEKRLKPYTKIEIIEIADEACPTSAKEAEKERVKQIEGAKILEKIHDDEVVIALDLHGKSYSSEELSQMIEETFTYKTDKIVFVIAGSLGYDTKVLERADIRWKLSDCTFPHQIVRVLWIEQVYRAYKIMKNEQYHK